MHTANITIEGMRDEYCLRAVTNAIQDLPAIGHIHICLNSGEATVEHGPLLTPDDIRQAVEDAGYRCS